MKAPSRILLILIAATTLLLSSCGKEASSPSVPSRPARRSGQPVILTTFYPTTYFAQRISGGTIPVRCPIPDGEDPIFWKPTPAQIAEYQDADLVIINGASYEKWLSRAALPLSRLVDAANPLVDSLLEFKTVTHKHGGGGAHTHAGVDGHTWVDPVNAAIEARQILTSMIERFPEHAAVFRKNGEALLSDLDGLHREMGEAAAAIQAAPDGVVLIASHPAYNYLARRYHLRIINVELDPEAVPTDEALAAARLALADAPPTARRIILWESQPSPAAAREFRDALNAEGILFSPCENPPAADLAAGADYLWMMKANIARLRAAIPGMAH